MPGPPAGRFSLREGPMLTLYFCLDEATPILRFWPSTPRIGEEIALREFGMPLEVYRIVWEGTDEAIVRVYVRRRI
jgi:hypothetical protein